MSMFLIQSESFLLVLSDHPLSVLSSFIISAGITPQQTDSAPSIPVQLSLQDCNPDSSAAVQRVSEGREILQC